MKQIIIDTSMLMAAAQFKVDIFSEIERVCLFSHEPCIIGKTIGELENIREKQKGRHKAAAKLALALVNAYKIKKIHGKKENESGYVDDIILGIADKSRHVVATQDIALKNKLREKGIPIITLRQKKHLILQ